MRSFVVLPALAAVVSAHGNILSLKGANGAIIPGNGLIDGTRRDCIINACGAQRDTPIIRDLDIRTGKGTPLGWSAGAENGYTAERVVAVYMGTKSPDSANFARSEDEGPDNSETAKSQRRDEHAKLYTRQFDFLSILSLGGKRINYPKETLIGDTAGRGAVDGMPTSGDDGTISMIYRQINEDGAGPMTGAIDPSSGGTDNNAFQGASFVKNSPGFGAGGLSSATNTNYEIIMKMPNDMICRGVVAGVQNVCVARVRNQAQAGPFGGSACFVQSNAHRKRALEIRMKKRYAFDRSE